MEEGRVLPISGYFNAVITLPPLSVRDQFCKEAIRQGTVRDSGPFCPAAYATCLPLMERLLFH